MKAQRLILIAILWGALSLPSSSQTVIGRQLVDQFPTTWWNTITYGLTWLPPTYNADTTKRFPLILFLHGVGETGDGVGGLNTLLNTALPQKIANGWDPEAINPVDGQTYQFIVVSPQAPSASGWSYQWNSIQYILPNIVSRYRIDTSRIYITGLSAGGNGSWTCLTAGPGAAKKFAAAVTMASAPVALDSVSLLGSQYGVKLWQLCGDQDAFYNFSVTSTSSYNSGIPAPSPQANLTVFPGQGHWASVWNTGYDPNWRSNVYNKNIYEWMLQYQRTFTTTSALSVNAGSNQTITLPTSQVILNGTATPGAGDTISSYLWTKVSGPAGETIVNASSASTTVSNLSAGVYVFKLKATSSAPDTAYATTQVTVNTATTTVPNAAPVANAGTNGSIILPVDSVQLNGSGTDSDGQIVSYKWEKISGPGQYVFVDSTQAQTMVNDLVAGTYQFELSVTDDSSAVAKDTVSISVLTTASNISPTVNAGNDITITLPLDSVQVIGTATDADGTIDSLHWSKISGPSSFTIAQPDSVHTMVNSLVQGTYKFELTAMDNDSAYTKDTVTVIVNAQPVSSCGGVKRYMIPGGDNGKYINGDTASWWHMQINPGDTLVLNANISWSYFRMENYQGTASCPIVVINEGGQVWMTSGLDATNCHYVKMTGSGTANTYYGFKVYNPGNDGYGVAIGIQGKSKHVEVERVDVVNKGYGVWAKQDPLCDQSFNYPNYVMDDIEIHHCRFKRIFQDCIYAGNTDPLGDRPTFCGGVETHPIPMRLSNINIHHLIIDSCGRTGIQLSGADAGLNQIHDNVVTRCGYEYNQFQGNAISIGGMTKNCYVYNNVIKHTFLYGIFDLGADSSFVYNNTIDSCGFLPIDPSVDINALAATTNTTALPGHILKNTMALPGNIQATTKPTNPQSTKTVFYKNNKLGVNATTVQPNGIIQFGWWGPAQDWTANNKVCHNTRLDGITPAKIDPFWYTTLNQYWPIIDTTCNTPGSNMPPTAFAGNDTLLHLPTDSVMLLGSGTDADGTIIAYEWTKISGPSQYTLAHADSAHTLLSNLVPGIYTFRLTVMDNDSTTASDDVQVSLDPPNSSPIANAGPNKVITLPVNYTTLNGSGVDPDGDPMNYHWTKVSGPSTYTVSDTSQATLQLTNMGAGNYLFEITVSDTSGGMDKDTVSVIVNIAPTVNAGPDQTIQLPVNSVTVNATASDVDGTLSTFQWTKISGPSSFTIVSPTQLQSNITNLVAGIYQFEITVKDNYDAPAKDTLTITVFASSNTDPIADAGNDITITLPTNSVVVSGSGADPNGTIVGYAWNYISGPSSYLVSSPTQAQTNIGNLVAGIYEFELTVTDNDGATAKDTMRITVLHAPNVAPVANAGSDITITLPVNNATLNGTASTDADGMITTYQWTKINGPFQYSIANPSQSQTAVNNLVQGIYQFELKVTDDSGAIALDTVSVTVNAAQNILPVVNAGPNQTITLPTNSVIVNGTATDADGTIVSTVWSYVSGPLSYSISNPNQAQTTITGLVQGVYVFRFTATDNYGGVTHGDIMITVNAAPPPPNVIPVANAGADIVLTLPVNNTTLNGSGTDADGTIVSYVWNAISGPSSYSITTPTQAQTNVGNLVQGVYEFELTVTDNDGAIAKDTVRITVNHALNVPPVANAGVDITITLPTNTTQLTGTGTDADGTIVSYQWTKINGPTPYNIFSSTQSQTIVNTLAQGLYQFELKVTDDSGAVAMDTINVLVNAAPPPPNVAPVANAGSDVTITLPVNSTSLNGSGTDPDGSITSYQWTNISGPAGFVIANASQAQTSVGSLQAGVYQFVLTVTDNQGATGTDTVMVTVLAPPPNVSPVANAGNDVTITLPVNSTALNGSGSDPDGSIVSYQWTNISGPAGSVIANASQAQTSVGSLQAGVYQFVLTVTDNQGATGTDTVMVTVLAPPPNVSPIANAGSDVTITLPVNSCALNGSGTDPDGSIVSYQWTNISGPGGFVIAMASQAQTGVTNLQAGVYQFVLTVTDNQGATASDTMMITVNAAAPPPNAAPIAHAGNDITITLPVNSVTLNGSGTDADGTVVSYSWSQISGPASFVIVSASQAQTVVNQLGVGVYKFELQVTDNNGAVGKDTVSVTVNAAIPPVNLPPVAHAGPDQAITSPANSVQLNGSGTDADGVVVSYLWKKISGPAAINIANANSAQTSVTGLSSDSTYQFELTVTDDKGATGKDTMIVVVNNASVNLPPIAKAGYDEIVYWPTDTIKIAGSGLDLDGTVVSYQWVKISGPAQYLIATPNKATTVFKNLVVGEYEFELTVTDNKGATGKDTVKVTMVNYARLNTQTIIFPNPVTTELNVRIVAKTQRAQSFVAIYDSKGALVYKEEFMRTNYIADKRINVSNLASGSYMIAIGVDINNVQTLQFMK